MKTKAFFLFLFLWAGFYFTIFISPPKLHPGGDKYTQTLNLMRAYWHELESQAQERWPKRRATVSECNQLIEEFAHSFELSQSGSPVDAWGNSLNFLANLKRPPDSISPTFLVYSDGEDGVSGSGGNDRDDISLWVFTENLDEESLAKGNPKVWKVENGKHKHYQLRREQSLGSRVWSSRLGRSMIFASILFLVLVMLRNVFRVSNGKAEEN